MGKYNDQVDATSQALDWFKQKCMTPDFGLLDWLEEEEEKSKAATSSFYPSPLDDFSTIPGSRPCTNCNRVMSQIIPGCLKCMHCGAQWPPPGDRRSAPVFT